jgi:3-methyladenine DNA glycosylase AlkD
MKASSHPGSVDKLAAAIDAELKALPDPNTSTIRAIRRKYSRALKPANANFVLRLARALCQVEGYRWFAYELMQNHPATFERLDEAELEYFGHGLNSWWTVDSFARILSGPAWLKGQVSDNVILKWARSPDRWRRRAALVSTVALNVRSHGGGGDVSRTLRVCRLLAKDHDDLVAKALSWALRALVAHDAKGVQTFLDDYNEVLAALVKREVKNKLKTGLKNPSGRSRK